MDRRAPGLFLEIQDPGQVTRHSISAGSSKKVTFLELEECLG